MTRVRFIGCMVVLLSIAAISRGDDAITLANVPPVVVKTVPEAGSDGVDPAITEITVTFSKDMADHTWSWSTASKNSFPETTGKPYYNDDKRTCVLPVRLKPGATYAVWLNSGNFGNFKDASGNSAVPYLLVFATKKAGAAEGAKATVHPPLPGNSADPTEFATAAWMSERRQQD
jgi:hypothetical protein